MKKQIKPTIIAIILVFLSYLSTSAQNLKGRNFCILENDFVDTVKIKIWHGAIIVPVEINGSIRDMLFDTGADEGIWFGEAEEWMTSSGYSTVVKDSYNRVKKKERMKIPSMKIGGITITDYPVIIEDGLNNVVCGMYEGALGFNLVSKGISIKIDTKDSLMIMTSRKHFFRDEERGLAEVKYNHESWFTPSLLVSPKVRVQFPFGSHLMLFDSGYIGGWFNLSQNILKEWTKNDTDTTIMTGYGVFSQAYDTIVSAEPCIPNVQIGDLHIKEISVGNNSPQMMMGSAILERVSLIIDAHKECFVFIPHDVNSEIVVNNKTLGLRIIPAEDGDTLGAVKVVVANKGTKAYEMGVRTGDYLISIDGTTITDYCTYVSKKWREKWNHIVLRSPEGEVKEISGFE